MEFNQEEIKKIIRIRSFLIESHKKHKDYRSNKNAIMREVDHVQVVEKTIKELDEFLKKYVEFK